VCVANLDDIPTREEEKEEDEGWESIKLCNVIGFYAGDALRVVLDPHMLAEIEVPETRPMGYIVKVSGSKDERHWCLVYLMESGKSTFYCSRGQKPKNYPEVHAFISKHSTKCSYNATVHQSGETKSCGAFSATALFFLLQGFEPKHVYAMFSSTDTEHNEKFCKIVCDYLRNNHSPVYSPTVLQRMHEINNVDHASMDSNCFVCEHVIHYPLGKIVRDINL